MKEKTARFENIISELLKSEEREYDYFHNAQTNIPQRKEIIAIIKNIQSLMFPDYFHLEENNGKTALEVLLGVHRRLVVQIGAAYAFCAECESDVDAESLASEIAEAIPRIKEALIKDVQAIYEGDPAARSPEEIILSYPGFYAISIYRIAHEFYIRRIPYLARLMTEYAHEKTGIDIHAGATIGEYFFIDHGTGVVIGETAVVGDDVVIYQGVTLGGTGKDTGKRHPTIEDRVMLSAGAKVLGSFRVGHDSRIGAGSVVLKPVPPHSTVVGVPGRVVKTNDVRVADLDQVHVPDPILEEFSRLNERIIQLEKELGIHACRYSIAQDIMPSANPGEEEENS